jgi:polysaccharide export outer membrane protein
LIQNLSVFLTQSNNAGAGKSETGLYFDGFTVDDHGNIQIPLGELNVIGYNTLDEVRIRVEKAIACEYFNKEAIFL